jgi:hypothetical protein
MLEHASDVENFQRMQATSSHNLSSLARLSESLNKEMSKKVYNQGI